MPNPWLHVAANMVTAFSVCLRTYTSTLCAKTVRREVPRTLTRLLAAMPFAQRSMWAQHIAHYFASSLPHCVVQWQMIDGAINPWGCCGAARSCSNMKVLFPRFEIVNLAPFFAAGRSFHLTAICCFDGLVVTSSTMSVKRIWTANVTTAQDASIRWTKPHT